MSKKKDDTVEESEVILDEETLLEDKKLTKAKKELKKAQEEKKEYLDGWQRSRAELLNYKKDVEKRMKNLRGVSRIDAISEVMPVLDSFELAFKNKESWESVDKNWRVGVEYIYNQLQGVLDGNGVKCFTDDGKDFDPARHESVGVIEVDDFGQDGKILEVLQKGYESNGRILRPAQVKVGTFKKN